MAKAQTTNGIAARTRNAADGAKGRKASAAAVGTKATARRKKPAVKRYTASIFANPEQTVPDPVVQAVRGIEKELGMRVWLMLHDLSGDTRAASFIDWQTQQFYQQRGDLPSGPLALLLDSPGGNGRSAFQLARLLRRQCGTFVVLVPRYAKSAATLFALGADRIILGECGELGPLDAQYDDPDKEERTSALDEVQSIQRLHADALTILDQTMIFLAIRTKKKLINLLPHALQFTSDMMRPLIEKLDVVHYSQRARDLKVAEEYAIRLLTSRYGSKKAATIARELVESYPEHGFVIDHEEAEAIGLLTEVPSPAVQQYLEAVADTLQGNMFFTGQIKEAPKS